MATRRRTHRGGDEDEEQAVTGELIESDVRPKMHVPGSGPERAVQVGPQAVDMTGYDEGEYIKKSEQEEYEAKGGEQADIPAPEPYGLKVIPDDVYGHTHHLKNNDHYWSGRKDQFELQFVEA
jgi:hypothetical protein